MSNPDNNRVKQHSQSRKRNRNNKRNRSSTNSDLDRDIQRKRIDDKNIFDYLDTFETPPSPRVCLVKRNEVPKQSCSDDPNDTNMSIDIFIQNSKTQFDKIFERLDALENKIAYLDHKYNHLDQENDLNKGVQSSLKDSFEKCLKEVGNLRTNIQHHDMTPSRFSHARTV